MQQKLSSLNIQELHDLFLKESLRFTEGMDDGLAFYELKQIRLNLKEIALELHNRKEEGDGDSRKRQ